MSQFPRLSESYYVDGDYDIKKRVDDSYARYITANQAFWSEAYIDTRFKIGDQSVINELYPGIPRANQPKFFFNRIQRLINMVSGYQRQNRKSLAASGVEGADDLTADQFSKILYYLCNQGNILETFSTAFEGSITCGLNLLSVSLDFTRDPVNGDIAVNNNSYSGLVIDPYFQKMDLSDCSSIYTRKYITKEEAMTLLPDREDDIGQLSKQRSKDNHFEYIPESMDVKESDLVSWDEFWYLDTRKQLLTIDKNSGECREWRGNDDDLQDYLSTYPEIVTKTQNVPTTKLAILLQGEVMYDGPNPLSIDRYPFVPCWCYYEPDVPYFNNRIQGMVKGLRDAQYLYNRRRNIELKILESQVTSGFIYKESALVNPKDVFLANEGKGIALKQEAQVTDIIPIPAPQIPPSMIQLSELLAKEVMEISGINEELLGTAEDDKAGVLAMLRQGAGLVTLQKVFDQSDQSLKQLGQILIEVVQNNFTPGKVKRIINEEPSDEFYDKSFGKYDCVIEEIPYTSTQKQMALKKALYLKEMGIPITTDYLIKHMNLPDTDELIESIMNQEKQQAEQQQKMEQLQLQNMQIDNETKLSYAEAEKSLAAERLNKIKLDAALSAERIQGAVEDRSAAVLNLVKAVREIQGIDLEHLERSLAIVQQVGNEEIAQPQSEEAQVALPQQIPQKEML